MKRVLIAVILAAFILGAGIWEQIFIQQSFRDLQDSLDQVMVHLEEEDFEGATELLDGIIAKWRKTEDYLELIAPHTDIKEVVVQLSTLSGFIYTELKEEAQSHIIAVKEICENRRDILSYNWKNVL